jgi:hypothetical protein
VRELAVGPIEANAAFREGVEVRGLDGRVTLTTEGGGEVVGENQENVGAGWCGSGQRGDGEREK